MKIVAAYIDDFKVNPDLYNRFFSHISQERAKKVNKFHFVEDRIRSVIGELLVRLSMWEEWGIENKDIHFEYNEFGKPRLKNQSHRYFNISHSGQWVVVALDTSPIGIDIEKIQPIDFRIGEKFFTSLETRQILCQPKPMMTRYFYKFWTLKESYIKAIGKGLSIPLDSFSFDLSKTNISLQTSTKDGTWFFKLYEHLPDYELAVCCSHENIQDKVEVVTISELLDKLHQLK
ncbi:4'-phosphopantetheinyl transferase family protein [Paenibacillus sp. DMB20]|uniref:4'-phosphopantetheinyl transferase family protein n=1 Tax=Paenibacillus sp. DMB20 TaxID=1642570 RepID=UPI000627BBD5|nr:4'-phosphopantetheinyl transferase superfamily protein [Paenibacillus sp. DMB20]KKO55323.1 hypothetical protein XI25_00755 [Paenibacillus sp. DMB20]